MKRPFLFSNKLEPNGSCCILHFTCTIMITTKEVVILLGWQLFKKKVKEMKFGDQVLDGSPFIAIIDVEGCESYARHEFIKSFTNKAYSHGLIRSKKYYAHINYWYDGPVGHTAQQFWDVLQNKEVSHSVVFITRLLSGYADSVSLAKKIADKLLERSNIILLIPEDEVMAKEEMAYYRAHFPNVPIVKLNSNDIIKVK